jgi:SulP family sulfate permease
VLDRIGASPKLFILDFADVPLVDSTAARTLESFAHKLQRHGTKLYFTSANRNVRRTLLTAGLRSPLVRYADDIEDAVAASRTASATPG